jgi:hypothetical protein
MARRGSNSFRRNDGLRALRIARDGGIEPAMLEIVAKDGTIFRVYGENASPTETTDDSAATKAWDEAVSKPASEHKKGRRGGKNAAD